MEKISDEQYLLGESPIWNRLIGKLMWVDIDNHQVLSFDDHKISKYSLKRKPTSIGLIDESKIFLTVDSGCGIFDLRSEIYISLAEVDKKIIAGTRLNDGKCDRNGTYWVASKDLQNSSNSGVLFCFADNEFIPIVDQFGIGNGLAFSTDDKKMFFADSLSGMLVRYEKDKMKLNNPRMIFASNPEKEIVPDGGTVDYQDRYYSAMWGGGHVAIFDSYGRPESTILVPEAKNVTNVAFGGDYLDRLFVTSSKDTRTGTGGQLFYQKLNTFGVIEPVVKFN